MMIRHGDLLFVPLSGSPPGWPEKPLRTQQPEQPLVVAEGEATGHRHVVTAPEGVEAASIDEIDGVVLHLLGGAGLVTHEEHGPLELPAEWYRVPRQREYVPAPTPRVRRVRD